MTEARYYALHYYHRQPDAPKDQASDFADAFEVECEAAIPPPNVASYYRVWLEHCAWKAVA